MVATRMRDKALKRDLKRMPRGPQLKIDGPLGSLTLHSNASRPAVLLAGGIGITPSRGMIVNAARKGLTRRVMLFYSNRRREDYAFLQELQEIGSGNKNYQTICAMTKMEKSERPWQAETRYINKATLARFVPDVAAPIYYITGPPALVTAMKETLTGAGLNEDDTRSDDFAGY